MRAETAPNSLYKRHMGQANCTRIEKEIQTGRAAKTKKITTSRLTVCEIMGT